MRPTTARLPLALGLFALPLLGCGDDALHSFNRPAAPLADPLGVITGRVCSFDSGTWLAGVTASVVTDGRTITDVTDSGGSFALEDVPAGTYAVFFTDDVLLRELSAVVLPGGTTVVGDSDCRPPVVTPPGGITGRICDSAAGRWAADVNVSISGPQSANTLTSSSGHFSFTDLAPGIYTLTSTLNGNAQTSTVSVVSGEVSTYGPAVCALVPGTVQGRICAGGNYWVAGATVTATLPDGTTLETVTRSDGSFTLSGLPAGEHELVATRGSFSVRFTVRVEAGQVTEMQVPMCMEPTTRIAVVTGYYDSMHVVLESLGFPIRAHYKSRTPEILDPTGNVDLIHGDPGLDFVGSYDPWANDAPSKFWIREFLADPVWMADYDIIMINCGVNDSDIYMNLSSVSPAVANLRAYVAAGGSVYVSDWASEIARLAFPGSINYVGSDLSFGLARTGSPHPEQPSRVVDPDLAVALGRTDLNINLGLGWWVVLEPASSQPSTLYPLVNADVIIYTDFDPSRPAARQNVPLIVRFDHGDGRVLLTSAHTETQTTADLRDVIRYAVFEL